MAENKILKEEILKDAELEEVAGGSMNEINADYNALYSLSGSEYLSRSHNSFRFVRVAEALQAIGKDLGINIRVQYDCNIRDYDKNPNKYFIGGEEISRAEFWTILTEAYNANKK